MARAASTVPGFRFDRDSLETIYRAYNRREYVHPDPIEFLYNYDTICEREIVGLVASSLAYGRVSQILKSVRRVLGIMAPSPLAYLGKPEREMLADFDGFKHRFTTAADMVRLLAAISDAVEKYGSLEESFLSGYSDSDENILPALGHFSTRLSCGECCFLTPTPVRGGACKRLNLFLRWMVRRDDVDPGGWHHYISPSKLIVPLDAHMFAIATSFGLTARRQADIRAAVEITAAFASIEPQDPVKYDFSLTRPGIMGNAGTPPPPVVL